MVHIGQSGSKGRRICEMAFEIRANRYRVFYEGPICGSIFPYSRLIVDPHVVAAHESVH